MKFSYRKTWSLLNRIGLGVVLITVSDQRTEAQALPPDVGIIIQLSDGVTYRNAEYQKNPVNAQVFMKILQGDYFQLDRKAMVQLVYFQNGRKETWKGPVAFTVDLRESQLKSEKGIQVQPEVKILPLGVLEGIRHVPVLLRRAGLSRSGTLQVRGLGESIRKSKIPSEVERAEIAMAKENYRNLREETKEDDLTPELYLLGLLTYYDQFEEIEKIIQVLLKKQPDNEVLKKLEEWVMTNKNGPKKR
jgi:hypothetical protein